MHYMHYMHYIPLPLHALHAITYNYHYMQLQIHVVLLHAITYIM